MSRGGAKGAQKERSKMIVPREEEEEGGPQVGMDGCWDLRTLFREVRISLERVARVRAPRLKPSCPPAAVPACAGSMGQF